MIINYLRKKHKIYSFFQSSKKNQRFLSSKMCLCTHKLLQVFRIQETLLPFLQKGEKTAELVFLFGLKLYYKIRNTP